MDEKDWTILFIGGPLDGQEKESLNRHGMGIQVPILTGGSWSTYDYDFWAKDSEAKRVVAVARRSARNRKIEKAWARNNQKARRVKL